MKGLLVGAALATIISIAVRDQKLQTLISHVWKAHHLNLPFDGLNVFYGYAVILIVLLCLILSSTLIRFSLKCALSWMVGAASACGVCCFGISFAALVRHQPFTWKNLIEVCGCILVLVVFDFLTSWAGTLYRYRTIHPNDILKRQSTETTRCPKLLGGPDDPIYTWAEDLLHRSALVDTLKVRLLIARVPVIAIRGAFGDGKSSVMNLLKMDLENQSVTVHFNTWLPGCDKTLVNDLLADIYSECKRRYVVPGLRKSLITYARAVAGGVPYLKGVPELFPEHTQRQEISELGRLLENLPRRVIVFLDEIDRMRKKEIVVLLKLIRGVSSLPNLSFVCAFDSVHVERLVCGEYGPKSHEYFQKFFPNNVDLPPVNEQILVQEFVQGITKLFVENGWII